jgi:hypothetical protein
MGNRIIKLFVMGGNRFIFETLMFERFMTGVPAGVRCWSQ